MAFVFVLLGGMLGGMVAGMPAALIGAVVAPLLWLALRKEKSALPAAAKPVVDADIEPAMTSLVGRVQALEKEVASLRAQVQRLSQGAVTSPDSTQTTSMTPEPVAAEPDPIKTRQAGRVAAPAV